MVNYRGLKKYRNNAPEFIYGRFEGTGMMYLLLLILLYLCGSY